ARSLTFASTFARRATEVVEEGERDARVGKFRGAESGRDSGNPRLGSRRHVDGVKQDFGRQASWLRARIVDLVVLVPRVRGDRMLVGSRLADGAQHVLDVEAAMEEIIREGIQKGRVGGRVSSANVIDRF